ncbi:MAG: GHKL domain-containing protein [Bacilli bacterium]|nr:GHKL domain-containing protein [Bacilli bacterium]
MMQYLVYFINSVLTSFTIFYVSSKIYNKNIDFHSKNFKIILFLSSISLVVTYATTYSFIKIIINFITFCYFDKLLFNFNLIKTLLGTFIAIFILAFSEFVYTILAFLILGNDLNILREVIFASIVGNVFIGCLSIILISNIKLNKKLLEIVDNIENKSRLVLITILAMTLITSSMLFYYIYFEISIFATTVINIIIILVYFILTLVIFKERKEKDKLFSEYEGLIKNIDEYEKMLDSLRLNNHESKNRLIVIQGMIGQKDKNVSDYIDSIIQSEKNNDKDILILTKRVPIGGLQGLIYQKLLVMKAKNINFNLNIDKKLDRNIVKDIEQKTNQNLCTIVGIELDNAIEAVDVLNKKCIDILIYYENDSFNKFLVISIANNFSGNLNLDKIDLNGYSTKGSGRGYGLSIVKQILGADNSLNMERQIIKDVFKQILKIKL